MRSVMSVGLEVGQVAAEVADVHLAGGAARVVVEVDAGSWIGTLLQLHVLVHVGGAAVRDLRRHRERPRLSEARVSTRGLVFARRDPLNGNDVDSGGWRPAEREEVAGGFT